jgi:hypothetical protein
MSLLVPVAIIALLAFAGGGSSKGGSGVAAIPNNLVVGTNLDFSYGVYVDVGPDVPANIVEAIINATEPHARANPDLVFNIVTNNEGGFTTQEEEGIMIDGVHDGNLLSWWPDINEVKSTIAKAVSFAKTGNDPDDAANS